MTICDDCIFHAGGICKHQHEAFILAEGEEVFCVTKIEKWEEADAIPEAQI
jgi:hypothetical protein